MIRQLTPWIVALVLALTPLPAIAGPAGELAEWMIKQGAKFSDDVAGKSARELGKELEELSLKASDDAVEAMIKRGGPGALKSVRELGDHAPDAVRLIAKHGEAGKLVVEQGKTAAVDAFRLYGDDGIRVLAAQGASKGGQMLSVYGKALVPDNLGADSMAQLRHWLPQVEQAPSEWRAAFGEKLRQGGDDFVVWVGKRWKELALGGGLAVGAITAYKVGDGIAEAIPNPAKNPAGWIAWWAPLLIGLGILSAAWVIRHAITEWMRRARSPIED